YFLFTFYGFVRLGARCELTLYSSYHQSDTILDFGFWILDFGLETAWCIWVFSVYLSQSFFELVLNEKIS
ncbi:hypothetical protein, partial [uncultured Nostoc sp.]